MHVIIWMNKLLQCEKKTSLERILPLQNYNKINKLLRNLIIHSASTIELT